ncbi:hypothetical protein LCGC14_1111320 [marine sediment metagenome]|uniref:Uncharacterized protein n=1 Tax=marine sediment metagenome TaxID=412755 RepID=A0A0F9PPQ5_9ZZZZ
MAELFKDGRPIQLAISDWEIGVPSLTSRNNGKARWIRGSTSPLDQKGSTGWLADLYGGVQSGWNDYARINIPINEKPITWLQSVLWSYYMTEAESFGINMVIFIHDPTDFDKRAEMTQQADIGTLEKGAGWNAHELDVTTDQFYFYGENTTGTDLTSAAPNYYGLDDFQGDALFKDWTIYRITFDNGWQTANNEFKSAYVADIKINGQIVPLGPLSGKHRKTVKTSQTMLATAKTTDEVIAHHTSSGVDWDFDFGGTGYITKAWLANSADITPRLRLYLFSRPPTGMLNDEGANTNPVTADLPYFLGVIDFPAMSQQGTGDAFALATPNTTGYLPLEFDAPTIYGVLVQRDATATFTNTALTISLTADMEDN